MTSPKPVRTFSSRSLGLALVPLALLASCASKKSEPAGSNLSETTSAAYTPGVAGGTQEDTITATATVTAIDKGKRTVTLKPKDGNPVTFKVPPDARNFGQVRVGDTVIATITQQINVFMDSEREPTVTHAAALARSPQGAKPGAVVAEVFEIVATVESIDATSRQATLRFSDGSTKKVSVRPDVDLTKYKAGDKVVIQVNQQLAVLVEAP